MLLIITTIILSLVAINFLLLKFSSTSSKPLGKQVIKKDIKTDVLRQEIELNVQRRLETPVTYLKVV